MASLMQNIMAIPAPVSTTPPLFTRAAALWRFIMRERPEAAEVWASYNRLRQEFVFSQVVQHFSRTADDPAPLFGYTLLDIGCGTSSFGEVMALSGAEVTAIDIDPHTLTQASEKAEHYGTNIGFLRAKAEDLVRLNKQYDVILALDVLEYTDNLDKFLWAISRLLAPTGIVVFSTPNRTLLSWLYNIVVGERILCWSRPGALTFEKLLQPKELSAACQKRGLMLTGLTGLIYSTTSLEWEESATRAFRYMGVIRRK